MLHRLKQIASRLPLRWQRSLRQLYYWWNWQKLRRQFARHEKEFDLLPSLLGTGDWVLDIGANIGLYSARFSELVGATGRVIAIEPAPDTFAALARHVPRFVHSNVTLLNVAVSFESTLLNMETPGSQTGLGDHHLAKLTNADTGLQVLCLAIDSLKLSGHVRLIKLDVEGHELEALRGMRELLARDRPVIIMELNAPESGQFLESIGYRKEQLPASPNGIFHPGNQRDNSKDGT